MKNEKVIIVGASGSGKDFLLRGLIKKGLNYSPKYTTRPKRIHETNGIEYNFINEGIFTEMIDSNKLKVHQHFIINGLDWHYGISKDNFDKNQLFIMTPSEIKSLSSDDRKKCFVVYLNIDQEIRRKRISNRMDDNDSVDRRIEADKVEFDLFTSGYYDLMLIDPEFDIDMVYDLMD